MKIFISLFGPKNLLYRPRRQKETLLFFLKNDLEVFIDGGDCYYELEVNALNTVYEVFFIWKDAYKKGGRFDVAEFDVHKEKAMTFGGDYDRTGSSFWWGRHPKRITLGFPGL